MSLTQAFGGTVDPSFCARVTCGMTPLRAGIMRLFSIGVVEAYRVVEVNPAYQYAIEANLRARNGSCCASPQMSGPFARSRAARTTPIDTSRPTASTSER